MRKAIVAGGTGLVGRELLNRLLNDPDYTEVHAVNRRAMGFSHPKLTEYLVDFDMLSSIRLPQTDDAFCALGTTIKQAGTPEAFRRVDLDFVTAFAAAARQAGAKQFLVVSAIMANPASTTLYLRTKGDMESAVSAIPFSGIHIFRPATLMGDRDECRPGEFVGIQFMKLVGPLMLGKLHKFRNIAAGTVALAMITAAKSDSSGVRVYESDVIQQIAD